MLLFRYVVKDPEYPHPQLPDRWNCLKRRHEVVQALALLENRGRFSLSKMRTVPIFD